MDEAVRRAGAAHVLRRAAAEQEDLRAGGRAHKAEAVTHHFDLRHGGVGQHGLADLVFAKGVADVVEVD